MTQNMKDLERDIEESRARLDLTIDRLQDKLSVSGVVDDLLGAARRNHYAPVFDNALTVMKQNPIPVMLVAAGVGWLIHRMSRDPVRARRVPIPYDDVEVPVVNTGHARVYEPGASPLRPMQDPMLDTLETRREFNARA